ncbi:uncharacterized protein SPPG_06818 [Spizellomyces punctatus DAOM BR117]|uniref:Uncharacterized protein n=1 Tax=Spizellomyces punctatus (strain DAOM BR117) TaxID=645134 RepID=A0A0L0H9F6_SPIPD|nr:uncharacterized protein SPPG_06818 [Spizellomyces punctatus DAOM BR117]KNC97822.1 hypothetical protein SPPG_06818 [Spizellomyces punctatus DAOM BR117]|eukprot:XP_016605862.1 hypothetical protein SPPG_06818 [Spizellomyces punctatus DAOM BR117]
MAPAKKDSKAAHRFPKKTKAAKPPPEPSTFEEFLDEALSLEDKGDRYVSGIKAHRFYTRATEMYAQAHRLVPSDMQVLYNWGRILLLLSEFTDPAPVPEDRKNLLQESIEKLRQGAQDGNVDCLFNLSQALRGFAEVVLEEGVGDVSEGVRGLVEADCVLDKVFCTQVGEWERSREGGDEKGKEKEVELEGQVCTAHSHEESTVEEDQEEKHEERQGEDDYEMVTKVDSTTLSTLLDTLNAHIQTLTLLFKELSDPESTAYYEKSLEKLSHGQTLLSKYASTIDVKDVSAYTAEFGIRGAEIFAARADSVLEQYRRLETSCYEEALKKLDGVLSTDKKNVEALCCKGDVLVSWSDAIKTMNGSENMLSSLASATSSASGSSLPTPANDALTQMRTLYAAATTAYTDAYTITPTNANIAKTLGDTHLIRIPLYIPKDQITLALNAEKYYRRTITLCDDNQVIGPVLLRLAIVLSWADKESECKKVLVAWKKKGCPGVGEDESGVPFKDTIKNAEWFEALLGGLL